MQGCFFDIQRFSVHDGPGIRTIVFFKGCPLRCIWCCNPESQSMLPELMYNPDKCIGCGNCIPLCTEHAILQVDGRILFDRTKCNNCGNCVDTCYAEARTLRGRTLTLNDVMQEVEKDIPFYKNSGGGVTLSGGEPLQQLEFALALLRECKKSGIHTAMETCGAVANSSIEQASGLVDLFLYDIKHMDSAKHKAFTGLSNDLILRNCQHLIQLGCKVIIRVPVVPTFNDDEQSLGNIVEFAQRIGVNEVHLLPYHSYAVGKYKLLSRDYWDSPVNRIERKTVEDLREKIILSGISIKIGG